MSEPRPAGAALRRLVTHARGRVLLESRAMKFLCLDCDAPMKLHSTEGPDAGSLTVVFRCPECGFRVAMLTNPFETQMVRSLGVKVGGRTVPAEPFENLRQRSRRFTRADHIDIQIGKVRCMRGEAVGTALATQSLRPDCASSA